MADANTADPSTIIQQWLEEARASGEADAYDAKRAQRRYAWYQPLELKVGDRIYYINSRDINEEAVGVTCRHELRVGDIVYLRRDASEPWVRSRVKHVTQTVGSYKAGIQLFFDIEE